MKNPFVMMKKKHQVKKNIRALRAELNAVQERAKEEACGKRQSDHPGESEARAGPEKNGLGGKQVTSDEKK